MHVLFRKDKNLFTTEPTEITEKISFKSSCACVLVVNIAVDQILVSDCPNQDSSGWGRVTWRDHKYRLQTQRE